MKQVSCFKLILGIIAIAMVLSACSKKHDVDFPVKFVGDWLGKAIFKQMPVKLKTKEYDIWVNLKISKDGNVTGTVGDAKIQPSFLEKNTTFQRSMGYGDWHARVVLNGKLLEVAPYVGGEGCFFFKNLEDGTLHTSFELVPLLNGEKVEITITTIPFRIRKEPPNPEEG